MEQQGIVLHGFLLWAGGLCVNGLAENGKAQQQSKPEAALSDDTLSRNAGTAKWISHSSKIENAMRLLLVKSRQIARRGTAKKLLGRHPCEEPEVRHHVRLVAVTGRKRDLRKSLSWVR